MKKWHFVIDIEKCLACFNCLVVCKDEFDDNTFPGYSVPQPRFGQKWIDAVPKERGQYPNIDVAYLPKVCMHCANAPCVKASGGAIQKRQDGIVLIDPVKAKGKKDLVKSCPYGLISWNEEANVAQKCTFCAHLIDQGWTKTRCSQACPLEAIKVVYMEDAEFEEMVKAEKLEAYKPELKTKPGGLYKNLYRYTKCFISGSVAYTRDGIERCAEGCKVILFKDKQKIAEQTTDNFGDFKFDKLDEKSGKYQLEFYLDGYNKIVKEVDLATSLNMGEIHF
ncbi:MULTISPECIES: 4Fe-4S dicluster domain-containing protein [unclassified Dehalobacter]|uniref:4Fe-4S dicluster domain-containing protein n=1 Tax=unclassified Dehalobacter TaxID=2635733 RepID=UPI000E6C2B94|nr:MULTISPECIES: 4Fe-4S dicluster domain-containing protein [unclassified Dehalobacter]RJE46774.1 oxidoreductase [Dehalobacter sp. MCB1]TCX49265.1 oxidoreductase [Dehalobacter sp. 14DCB1]TCX49845.1 oxidoreductase [Dehalobacter sp. 12DCB1]